MMHTYNFKMSGSAAHEQTWEVEGTVTCEFPNVTAAALKVVFNQLTRGKAIFGRPGIGCQGPYVCLHFEVDQQPVVVHMVSRGDSENDEPRKPAS